jgi:integrase
MNTQQYLDQVRATTGFTDYRIAKELNVQPSLISRYNLGKLSLSETHAFQFSEVLKMPVGKIIADTKLENAQKKSDKKKIKFWQFQVNRLSNPDLEQKNAEEVQKVSINNLYAEFQQKLNNLQSGNQLSKTKTVDYEPSFMMSELADKWYSQYGFNLKTGKKRLQDLQRTIKYLGNPKYSDLTATQFVEYRTERIEKGKVKPRMVNYEMSILSTMINELRRMGYIDGNPLVDIRKLKEGKMQTTFLELDQLMMLLNNLKNTKSDAFYSALICLSTGSRWGETLNLKKSDVNNNLITFRDTKNGSHRSVPVTQNIIDAIKPKLPLNNGYKAFVKAMAVMPFDSPPNQMTHILRHSFASHFIISGGQIEILQKILGHSDTQMTNRYMHLKPNHLKDAEKLNPLALKG